MTYCTVINVGSLEWPTALWLIVRSVTRSANAATRCIHSRPKKVKEAGHVIYTRHCPVSNFDKPLPMEVRDFSVRICCQWISCSFGYFFCDVSGKENTHLCLPPPPPPPLLSYSWLLWTSSLYVEKWTHSWRMLPFMWNENFFHCSVYLVLSSEFFHAACLCERETIGVWDWFKVSCLTLKILCWLRFVGVMCSNLSQGEQLSGQWIIQCMFVCMRCTCMSCTCMSMH